MERNTEKDEAFMQYAVNGSNEPQFGPTNTPRASVDDESVVDLVDHMRNEGGLAPEIPHTSERVDERAGSVINVED